LGQRRTCRPETKRRTFHTVNPLLNPERSWNVVPTQMAPVVRRHPETGRRHLDLLQWGLLPYFTKDPVHARPPMVTKCQGTVGRITGRQIRGSKASLPEAERTRLCSHPPGQVGRRRGGGKWAG
jgi:SOS response associated peptidase (SRAP)